MARFTAARVEKLLLDPGIIRNRAKVEATVRNARAFLAVQEEFGTFDVYLWGFVGGHPVVNKWRSHGAGAADLSRVGGVEQGPAPARLRLRRTDRLYAHLQAAGLVNDHLVSCFRYDELTGAGAPSRRGRRSGP